MCKLSIGKYAGLCLVGGELAYTVCMAYGMLLAGEAAKLHLALFQLLPGVTALDLGSWIMGAISVGAWSLAGGAFISWMHNVSLEQ